MGILILKPQSSNTNNTFTKQLIFNKMKVFITGNGNIQFREFLEEYVPFIDKCLDLNAEFLISDFRGVDVLTQEYLKDKTRQVSLYVKHKYRADKYKTYSGDWLIFEGFLNDAERDLEMLKKCTHIIAVDYNSDENRKSGTLKNIENAKRLNKIHLNTQQ